MKNGTRNEENQAGKKTSGPSTKRKNQKERKVGMMNKKTVVERKKVASKHKKEQKRKFVGRRKIALKIKRKKVDVESCLRATGRAGKCAGQSP